MWSGIELFAAQALSSLRGKQPRLPLRQFAGYVSELLILVKAVQTSLL